MKQAVLSAALILSLAAQIPGAEAAGNAENSMTQIIVTVNGHAFEAELDDTETARAFARLLPLTLRMPDFGGNEKTSPFPNPLPSEDRCPKRIRSGDLKLWDSGSAVLFYKSFPTVWCYSGIGRITNPEKLEEAAGKGTAEVSFALR